MDESDPLADVVPSGHRWPGDVRGKLYTLALVDEFAPLYALFTL